MRQSLHELNRGEWKTAFPIAISPDLRSVVILRTLYVFNYFDHSSHATWKKAVIPIESLKGHESKWTDNLTSFDPNHHSIRGKPLMFIYRDRYVYSIGFSRDGHYLSFRDSIEFYDTLVVFEILKDGILEVKTVNLLRLSKLSMMSKTSVFHPKEEVMAFATTEGVELWKFRIGMNVPPSTASLEDISPLLLYWIPAL
jgi:hypothetical protein